MKYWSVVAMGIATVVAILIIGSAHATNTAHKFEEVGTPLPAPSEDAKRAVAEIEELNRTAVHDEEE